MSASELSGFWHFQALAVVKGGREMHINNCGRGGDGAKRVGRKGDGRGGG